jgi:predicted phage terminase large subunit-like protein
LHPQHESAAILLDLKRSMGSMSFSAQYQQTPIPIGGTFIKSKWLKSHTNITFEPTDRIVLSWDIALSEAQTGDYSAGVVLLNRGETFYVLEVVRGRFPFPQLIEKIMEMCRRYPRGALLIEDSPISKGLIQSIKSNNINVVTVTPDKDKLSRVISQGDLFEGGSISIPARAEWRDGFLGELLAFPGGQNDDQVALVQGLAWQRSQWMRTIKVRPTTGY